jgi:hypothetical protein
MPCQSYLHWLDCNYIWRREQVTKLLIMQFPRPAITSSLLGPNILYTTLLSNTLSLCSSMSDTRFHTHIKHKITVLGWKVAGITRIPYPIPITGLRPNSGTSSHVYKNREGLISFDLPNSPFLCYFILFILALFLLSLFRSFNSFFVFYIFN